MTDINQLIQTCAEITKSKGFDTTQHATQVALIATEVAEALECIGNTSDAGTREFIKKLTTICEDYEIYRKAIRKPECPYTDVSQIRDAGHLDEELADIIIRVFSYAGGNGRGEQLVQALITKIETNRQRSHRHGKAF
jgi:NTP pyrophosphatase (non-canonical NTP hydrolase)